MAYPTCRHILINGVRCKSPSLINQPLCFFHNRLHRRHRQQRERAATPVQNLLESVENIHTDVHEVQKNVHTRQAVRQAGAGNPAANLDLPPLENAESIQVAISLVVAALAENQIGHPHARVLLYGLQLASRNALVAELQPYDSNVIRQAVATRSGLDLTLSD